MFGTSEEPREAVIGLNVGSGQRRFDTAQGWINLDRVCRKTVKVGENDIDSMPDVAGDGLSLPFKDALFDYVVLHHTLEHAGLPEGATMLAECWRVLRTGGSLLVFLPDIRALAVRWISGRIDDYTFFVNCMGAYMGSEEDRHRWHYTMSSLSSAVRNAGFKGLAPFDWRTIPGASVCRDWWILGAEAVK